MIPRESLAMGNWVTDENGMPFFIDGLFTDEVYLNFEGNEADVWEVPYKDLQPIPLTGKILERMGFEKEELSSDEMYGDDVYGPDEVWFKVLNDSVQFRINKKKGSYEVRAWKGFLSGSIEKVQYLHTLQNFIFLASGIQLAGEDFNDNEVFKD